MNYQRILILALLIVTFFFPVYLQGKGMGDVSAFSTNMVLGNSENEGPEGFMLDSSGQLKGISSAPLGNLIHLEVYPFKSIFPSFFHAPVFGPKTAILRC
jgi:hypothetical protein